MNRRDTEENKNNEPQRREERKETQSEEIKIPSANLCALCIIASNL